MIFQLRRWWVVLLIFVSMACNQSADTLFTNVSPRKTNITFKNSLLETDEFNVIKYTYFYNGGGVAIGDVNNDERPDIYFTGNMVASHLYINQGDFEFKNVAGDAGVEAAGLWNTGVTMADVNDDGWLDIYICRSAAASVNGRRNLLYINKGVDDAGTPVFEESAQEYGLDDPSYSTQATFFDYDRDGDLDMYLLNHSLPEFANFTADLEHLKKQFNPHFSDKLFENQNGRFKDVSSQAGLTSNVLGFGLGVAVSDFNGDGWPDIYVSNDYHEEDYLYINQQNGTFKDELRSRLDYTSLFSMGSDAGDINNDGLSDIMSVDMLPQDNYRIKLTFGPDNYKKYRLLLDRNFYKQNARNMLQLNQGNGRFEEIGQLAGISNSDWSWSALMGDYDLDGWPDIFVSNGYFRDFTNMDFLIYAMHFKMENPNLKEEDIPIEQMIEKMPEINVANKMYKNLEGIRFSDVSPNWGFVEPELSNGAAYGDLDGDGDLDLVLNNVNAPASIFSNQSREQNKRHFLGVRPLETREAQPAIGAKVTAYVDSLIMVRELYSSRGFQSAVQPVVHFGLGEYSEIDSLMVLWPEGELEWFGVDAVDQYINLVKGTGSKKEVQQTKSTMEQTVFEQDSILSFIHQENMFNNFDVQSLLLRFYSLSGPSMSKGDVDGDGLEDLVIGGGPSQATTIWMGGANGGFLPKEIPAFLNDANFEDVATAIADLDNDGDQDILIASGGNYHQAGDDQYELRYYENSGRGAFQRNDEFPKVMRNAACLVTGDFNSDGWVDVFLGAGYKAQQYPLSGQNVVLWNKGGRFTSPSAANEPVANQYWEVDEALPFSNFICMAAAWKDIDADGKHELVLGGEWESVESWNYVDSGWAISKKSGEKGLVNSLEVVNLDDDPELEIIVGNWGENSQLNATPQQPLVLYYGDFDSNGSLDPILSYYIDGESYPFVSRDDLTGQLPYLKKHFNSYHDYGLLTMEDLLMYLPDPQSDSAHTLSTYILDFHDGAWKNIRLPAAAQVAPVFAVETMDYDQDGDLDLILTGNSTYNRVKIGEMEANHGVLLENLGGLRFQTVPPAKSGLDLSGEVRSVASVQTSNGNYVLFGVNDDRVASYKLNKPVPSSD